MNYNRSTDSSSSFPFSNTIDITDILLEDILQDVEDVEDVEDIEVNHDELKGMATEDKHTTPLPIEKISDIINTKQKRRNYGLVVERIHPTLLKIKKFGATNKKPVLPTSIDLRHKFPPCYDQEELGSCTANAVCAAFQYEDPSFLGSRLFIYYNERNIEENVSGYAICTLSYGIASLEKYGVCLENDWPYEISNYSQPPTPKCYTDATEHHVINAMNILNNPTSMKQCLAEGFPFVVGIQIYESFESKKVANTGNVPMPNISMEKCLGGHTVLVCGYDDSMQVWIIRNSWGTQWGDNGYFYLPYAYLLNPYLSSDLWYVSRVQKPESIATIKESEPIQEVVVRERSCTFSISTPELGPVSQMVIAAKINVPRSGTNTRRGWFSRLFSCSW